MLEWGVMQAGGKSARMGTDKAWLEIEGEPMIVRGLAALAPVVRRCALVVSEGMPEMPRYEELAAARRAALLVDRHGFLGPLGGLQTALAALPAESHAAVLACDLPFVAAPLLARLAERHLAAAADLTLPEDAAGRAHPLAAIYAARCLPAIEALLAARRLRVDGLYPLVRTQRIPWDDWRACFPREIDARRALLNLNTPDEIAALHNLTK